MKNIILLTYLLIISSCKELDYVSDSGFLNSAQANSYEFPLVINGSLCQDMDGRPGICVKQIKNNAVARFALPSRPYSYSLVIKCSSELGYSPTFSIPEGRPFDFAIEDFKGLRSFRCIGEIFPDDRPQEVSASFQVFFSVYDEEYERREEVIKIDDMLILGKHSKHVYLCNKKFKCQHKEEKTYVKAGKYSYIFTESDTMRFNHWGDYKFGI